MGIYINNHSDRAFLFTVTTVINESYTKWFIISLVLKMSSFITKF